jgi:hypothetical protein
MSFILHYPFRALGSTIRISHNLETKCRDFEKIFQIPRAIPDFRTNQRDVINAKPENGEPLAYPGDVGQNPRHPGRRLGRIPDGRRRPSWSCWTTTSWRSAPR